MQNGLLWPGMEKIFFWLAAKDFLVKLAGDFFIPICCFKLSYSPEAGGGLPKLVLQLVQKKYDFFLVEKLLR